MAVKIVMPSLGMYTIEGELTRWLVDEGAMVKEGQQILELTTEKTTVEIEAPAAGILHRVLSEGAQTRVEGLIGYILAPGEKPPDEVPGYVTPSGDKLLQEPVAGEKAVASGSFPALNVTGRTAVDAGQTGATHASAAGNSTDTIRVRISPMARSRAQELGLDIHQITGTGPGGRIVEADIEKAAADVAGAKGMDDPAGTEARATGAPKPAGAHPSPPERQLLRRVPLTGVRKQIAMRMQQSLLGTAQLTLTREVDATPLLEVRKALEAKAEGTKIFFDVLFAKSLALALRERPELNAIIENDQILILDEVQVGIAVSTDGGLIVPLLHDADRRSIVDLCRDFAGLVSRAREGKLQPAEYEGGTATITNLGICGIDTFTPILNPPESVILGVGRIAGRPFAREDGTLTVRQTVYLSLTFDHRVADGMAAALLLDGMIAFWPGLECR